jgi:glucose-1-phosphate adenylyltransferase
MDYSNMLADLHAKSADCSVACVEVPLALASQFGIMAVDDAMRIVDFLEKPQTAPCIAGKPDHALASMGIYAFAADFLYAELQRDHDDPNSSHDFGRDVIPRIVSRGLAVAHRFEDSCVTTTPDAEPYWRDVGTIDAYWAANLDLVMPVPSLDIYDPNWPIWTYQQQLPPAKFVFNDNDRRGVAIDSMVSGGCIVSGAQVIRSLLFSNVRVNSYAQTSEAVVLPEVDIGRHARLTKVVVDRGCRIPEGLVVGEDPALDAARFHRSDGGVVLINAEMLAAL